MYVEEENDNKQMEVDSYFIPNPSSLRDKL